MAVTQPSDLGSVIETRVSAILTEVLIQNSIMMGAVSDFTSQVGPGMDTLEIPLFAELAVQDVLTAGAVVPQTINPSNATLNLTRHKSVPFSIGIRAGIQSKVALIPEALRNGSMTLAAEVDDFLLSLTDGASLAAPDHRIALTADALADIRTAKQLLDVQNVPKSDRFIVASPGFMATLLSENNLIRAQEYGTSSGIQAGFVTDVYGFRLLESSSASIVDDGFHAFHRSACSFARQIMPSLRREEKVLEHRDDYSLSHLYGGVLSSNGNIRTVVFDSDGA